MAVPPDLLSPATEVCTRESILVTSEALTEMSPVAALTLPPWTVAVVLPRTMLTA